jgi:hypothetical protein
MGVADTGQMDVSQLLEETEEIKVEPVSTNIAAPPLPTPQEPEPDTIFDVEVMEEPQEVLQVTEAQDDQDFGNFFEPQKANGSTQAPQSLTLNKVQQDVSETFMVPQDSLETSEDSLGGDFSLDEEDGLAVDSTDMADLSDMLDDLDDE